MFRPEHDVKLLLPPDNIKKEIMPEDYTTAMLMSDVMNTVQANLPPIVTVALFLATINFVFGMLYFALDYLSRKPFR